MMTENKILPEEIKKKFLPFFESFKNVHGENLLSVFVYGSAAGQNFIAEHSDINSVFVFKKIDATILEVSIPLVSQGLKHKITAPLFMTKDDIVSSLDIFPIEFLEMKENHVLIYGEDILSGLNIQGEHIRIFCEQQVKGKLIRLRQAYLGVSKQDGHLTSLLKDSLNTLIPVFRNLLRSSDRVPPLEKELILRQLCKEYGLDENSFLVIYKHKTGDELMARNAVRDHFGKYLEQLSILAQKVDKK